MVLPLVAFAILALVVSKSLMSVVAREETPRARASYGTEPAFDTWGDGARSFLLPASEAGAEVADRSERLAR